MLKYLKKRVFWILASQRRNVVGRFLFSTAQSLLNALNNKINDSNLSGEFWFLENLNHSEIKVVFDVGANVGKWTLELNRINPEGSIYAFEPVPQTFNKLKEATKVTSKINCFCNALSDDSGKLIFNFFPEQSTFSSGYSHFMGNNGIKIEVDSISGDEFCKNNSINSIDLLKIDTEGFESKVLLGFKEMFEKGQIKMVQFEYGPLALESRFLLADFYKFFENHGFEVGKIFPNWIDFRPYSWKMENFVLANFVAVRKDLKHTLISDNV
ncbi:FkbM family methyltransferase [Algoriphagus marincola]|uniref:FkbM family methyltransferase n=1 Tax=Algoriphagus marincola TaxID=264027 RepID=UPI00041CC10A|nr:FkbM family methyltransferase [Algoriphagus marincola]